MHDATTPRHAAEPPIPRAPAFDYIQSAELFTRRDPTPKFAAGRSKSDGDRARSRATYRNALAYRRFATGAEAVRFAIEELPAGALAATVLVVGGDRYEPAAIRALYAAEDYPLVRRGRAL